MPNNPNDGTALGTGEVITDEFQDPSTGARRDPNLPPTGYKVPRSKIAVGPYGQDFGDVTVEQPLQTESRAERQALELARLRETDLTAESLQRRAYEYVSLADARGSHLTTRGQR